MVYPIPSAVLLLLLLIASPALAGPSAGASVDEPAALALLALGVTGLIIGRHVARRRD